MAMLISKSSFQNNSKKKKRLQRVITQWNDQSTKL